MDNPALGLDSVIFGSFSCISLDSIMDSIDSSQIPLLIGRGRRRRVEGAEEHPPRRLLPGWGSRGHAFNSGLASQMARSRDADADRCAVGGESVLLSASSPHDSSLRHSLSQLPGDALPPLSPRCRAQQAVRSGRCAFRLSVFSPARVAVCLLLLVGQGAEMEGRARLSWASFRGHRDRDDGGQDAEGEGAEQHRLDFYLGDTDASTAEPSGNVLDRPDRCLSTPSSCPSCRASRAGGFRRHNWRFRRSPAAQPFGSSACSLRRLS